MIATADRPTAEELDQLDDLLNAESLSRVDLVLKLRRIEQGLRDHGRELDRFDGLIDEADKVNRMSLAREDDRLRTEGAKLVDELASLRLSASGRANDAELRQWGANVVMMLREHRDAESSLVLESVDTEVGAGD
ncbi:MAG TPA: hypothetical protein VHR66_28540 [Gemmataceae bacterium]|jgi:hypothetical protein|nr:hypothetical protein [Gemmataceae bacterium]